ncbi:palmitoyl-protein thioesterase [Acrasis kona]|uniref:palmitoyl-CoA hydrolase n=1 Tax=Acrasis kona TaxID=1008807 RepID=A0AAW2YW43_9EUKA
MRHSPLVLVLMLLAVTYCVSVPVISMHGIFSSHKDFDKVDAILNNGRKIFFPLKVFENTNSLIFPLSYQLDRIRIEIEAIKQANNFTEFDLLCHSQGALLCRAYVMSTAHTCRNLISLSGPQLGYFGATSILEKVPFFKNFTRYEAHRFFYTTLAQSFFSMSNFWVDPFHKEDYFKYNTFMPLYLSKNEVFKSNFLRLKKAVFLGSSADEVIEPYQSSTFGYWDWNPAYDQYKLIPFHEQEVFVNDNFGLKTMSLDGRLVIKEVEEVTHKGWMYNETAFTTYVLPFLD